MFARYLRAGALVVLWVPLAIAQGQDSPNLARALERAERFDAALGPQPQVAVLDQLIASGKPYSSVVYPELGHSYPPTWADVDQWLAKIGQ